MRPIKALATTPPLTPDDTDSSNDRVVMVCHLIQTRCINYIALQFDLSYLTYYYARFSLPIQLSNLA